jgi:hypothetical protein
VPAGDCGDLQFNFVAGQDHGAARAPAAAQRGDGQAAAVAGWRSGASAVLQVMT